MNGVETALALNFLDSPLFLRGMKNDIITREKDPLEGRILYVLILTAAVQFLYPISISNSPLVLVGYQLFYMSFLIAGVLMVSSDKRVMRTLATASVAWLVVGTVYAFRPELQWANFLGYLLIIFFQSVLAIVLLRYIFRTRVVGRDILLAAVTVYLLLGAIFVPIYGIIETLTWFPEQTTHAFVDGLNDYNGAVIPWQTFVYYSYVTLTTMGYGDILPATFWARSAATLEAVVGVMYTAVIVARLVGLYAADRVEDEIKIAEHDRTDP